MYCGLHICAAITHLHGPQPQNLWAMHQIVRHLCNSVNALVRWCECMMNKMKEMTIPIKTGNSVKQRRTHTHEFYVDRWLLIMGKICLQIDKVSPSRLVRFVWTVKRCWLYCCCCRCCCYHFWGKYIQIHLFSVSTKVKRNVKIWKQNSRNLVELNFYTQSIRIKYMNYKNNTHTHTLTHAHAKVLKRETKRPT